MLPYAKMYKQYCGISQESKKRINWDNFMKILLDSGSGGKASQRLISDVFLKHFDNGILRRMDDAARLDMTGPLAMSTDGYTVTPLFFPGGSIGTLAVHGTVNDIAMLGAKPRYLSCAFILEEGLELELLERIVSDMAHAAHTAGVEIVTGDTKVVPRGACDKVFITTAGVGEILTDPAPSGHSARPGDAILVSGAMGDHGLTVMALRDGLSFAGGTASDSAPLAAMTERLITEVGDIHVLRDPTRGGLATTLNEIAEQSGVCCVLDEASVPVHDEVRSGCDILGLDPLYLANEGKLICILPAEKAQKALNVMHDSEFGTEAAVVGEIRAAERPRVELRTLMGGSRLLSMLEGAQLPRIC
jgi:hydrogenase expression/formation protein HypE